MCRWYRCNRVRERLIHNPISTYLDGGHVFLAFQSSLNDARAHHHLSMNGNLKLCLGLGDFHDREDPILRAKRAHKGQQVRDIDAAMSGFKTEAGLNSFFLVLCNRSQTDNSQFRIQVPPNWRSQKDLGRPSQLSILLGRPSKWHGLPLDKRTVRRPTASGSCRRDEKRKPPAGSR